MKKQITQNLTLALMSLCGAVIIPSLLGWTMACSTASPLTLFFLTAATIIAMTGIICQFFSILSLRKASEIDSLTGLLNRYAFNLKFKNVIDDAMKHHKKFHVLLLDLNRFKQVNDTLGHHMGDLLIKQISIRLQDAVRDGDIIARLGGDEFAIIVEDPSNNKTYEPVINRIIKTINTTIKLGDTYVYSSVSIGVATFPSSGTTMNDLVRCADVAMYASKRLQKDYSVYRIEDDTLTARDLSLLGEIRAAIADNDFELWYQPKRNTVTGKVESIESLVRWRHPVRGIINPDSFIPIVESSGMIRYLTQSVIKEATTAYKTLRNEGYDLDVSINISTADITDPSMMTTIIKSIVKADMSPSKLILEVTETAFMLDSESAFKVLVALESLGVKLSIDDFGTGYSSLLYLKDFPIYEIKLDRSFITDIIRNETGYNIVKSTINLAHDLNAITVAEGVENSEVETTLADLGCDYVQGYHIAKPMPLDKLLEWLRLEQPSTEHAA